MGGRERRNEGLKLRGGELAELREALADRYTIERELGRGGMATVFLAQDLRHERPVALKVLHPELAASLGPERFLREIKLAARLQHPHILTVYDSGDAGRAISGSRCRTSRARACATGSRASGSSPSRTRSGSRARRREALDYAHRHGIDPPRHQAGEHPAVDGQALVADFGIARALDAGATSG